MQKKESKKFFGLGHKDINTSPKKVTLSPFKSISPGTINY